MGYDDNEMRTLLANERTFLAWIRTALGLLAGAAALLAIDVPWPEALVRGLAGFLAVIAGTSAVLSWRRWAGVEEAIFAKRELPRTHVHRALALSVTGVAVVFAVLAVLATV
jgi:putative membrane protein